MTMGRKLALLTIAMWGLVGLGFGISFFGFGGPATYPDEGTRRTVGGIFLAFGLLGFPIVRHLVRRFAGEGIVEDERDERIGRVANEAGFITVLIFVFLISIGLWEVYEEGGSVPVGWMWFLAYASVIVGHLSTSIATLVVDLQMSGHAEG